MDNEIKEIKQDSTTSEANGQQLDDELILTNNVEEDPLMSFRQALHEQIHEDDDTPHGQDMSLLKILGGDFFAAQILRRNILAMIFISFFVIVYISNRYRCEKSMLEIDNLKRELQDMKYKALSTSSQLTEQSRQSNVLTQLKQNRDSVLHVADCPPFVVNIPEEKPE